MIHHYGTIAIEVDPRTGRGRVVLPRGDAKRGVNGIDRRKHGNPNVSEETAKLSTGKQGAKAHGGSQAEISTGLSTGSYDSKLEMLFEQHLMVLKFCGEITSYTYHPFTISLAEKRKYTPDFLLVHKHGHMTLVELKGSRLQKNARDSITRMHVAASRLPGFTWKLVQRIKGQWVEEVVS